MKLQTAVILSILVSGWLGETDGSCSPCECFRKSVPMLRNSILVADCSNLNLNQVPPSLPQNIEYLDISRNELSQISVENLQFPELRVLSLAENKLVSLPSDLFRNITELEHLDLQGNRILDIPGELFISTPSIRKVVGLHTVTTPVTLFHPARKMKSLSFIAEDDSISAKLFEATSLNELDMSFTNVEALPPDLFSSGTTTLRLIKLTAEKLTSLHQDIFSNLTQLELIHVKVEGMKELPLHIFHGVHDNLDAQLVGLNSIDNKYRDMLINAIMTQLQTQNARLREIMVQGVDHIDSHLFNYLVNLQTLIINKAKSVDPRAFQGLSRLDKLELTFMNISNIDSSWFDRLVGLKSLNLSHNLLSSIHDVGFSFLHSLDTLDLSANNFTVVNSEDLNSFRNYLKYIDFSFNEIEHLPAGILADTYALQEVRLQNNHIKELTEQHFTAADYQDVESYDYQFTLSKKELRNFDISNNNLETIDLDFFLQMGSIVVLNLASNNIKNVSFDKFPGKINIGTMILTNNPVFCSCEFVSFIVLSKRFEGEVLGQCHSPANLHGVPFMDVTIPDECFETVQELLVEMTTEEADKTPLVDEVTTGKPLGTLEQEITMQSDELYNFTVSSGSDGDDGQTDTVESINSTRMEYYSESNTNSYNEDKVLSSGDGSEPGLKDEEDDNISPQNVESASSKHSNLWKWVGVGVGAASGSASVPAFIWFMIKMRGYLYKRNYFTFEKKRENVI